MVYYGNMLTGVIALPCGPITGHISDMYCKGKRRPFVFVGATIWSASIFVRGLLAFVPMMHIRQSPSLHVLMLIVYGTVTTLGKVCQIAVQIQQCRSVSRVRMVPTQPCARISSRASNLVEQVLGLELPV